MVQKGFFDIKASKSLKCSFSLSFTFVAGVVFYLLTGWVGLMGCHRVFSCGHSVFALQSLPYAIHSSIAKYRNFHVVIQAAVSFFGVSVQL